MACDVLAVGSLTWDVVAPAGVRETGGPAGGEPILALPLGGKLHLDEPTFGIGGGAANVSVVAARLGCRTAAVGCVGVDAAGQEVVEHLAAEGVDVRAIRRTPDAKTAISLVLVVPDGERSALVHAGAGALVGVGELDAVEVLRPRWVYVASLRGPASPLFEAFARRAAAGELRLALNPGATQVERGTRGLRHALEACDLLVVNDEEARVLAGAPGAAPEALARDLAGTVRGTAVVTCGGDGAVAVDAAGRLHRVAPVAPAVVRSTLGAGDAFGAATVAWLAQGQPLEAALRAGAHAAAGVLGAADAHSAAPSLAALRAALKADSVEDRTTARDLTDGDLPAAA